MGIWAGIRNSGKGGPEGPNLADGKQIERGLCLKPGHRVLGSKDHPVIYE